MRKAIKTVDLIAEYEEPTRRISENVETVPFWDYQEQYGTIKRITYSKEDRLETYNQIERTEQVKLYLLN